MRRIIVLFLLSLTLGGLTSCATSRLRRTFEGSVVVLHLSNYEQLPHNAILDVYIDDIPTNQITDLKSPVLMTVSRGLHSFRVVSEEHKMEGSSTIFTLGTGNEQHIPIDLLKKTEQAD